MDEIAQRLKDTTDTCLGAYNTWCQDKKATDPTADLKEAVHELRKVASRLEIEIAKNEREELAQRPIPIPPHRASRRKGGSDDQHKGQKNEAPAMDSNEGKPVVEVAQKRRVVRRKKSGPSE